ncbi:hypothetical protein [Parendozoicomonas haliclonae]|uniref:Glycine zipper domain-containing protein n=1 Tax=Parendozoicomonas haliclonae TaxID=1960125 RepID=A0A1X7AGT6_9GAMM|nr:hypothetical protein [Parendozoicomonas haliclonae]SMA40696.1 hypothetical protein EHSB41UT_01226 [Parendozoicomonas haliclonae]
MSGPVKVNTGAPTAPFDSLSEPKQTRKDKLKARMKGKAVEVKQDINQGISNACDAFTSPFVKAGKWIVSKLEKPFHIINAGRKGFVYGTVIGQFGGAAGGAIIGGVIGSAFGGPIGGLTGAGIGAGTGFLGGMVGGAGVGVGAMAGYKSHVFSATKKRELKNEVNLLKGQLESAQLALENAQRTRQIEAE